MARRQSLPLALPGCGEMGRRALVVWLSRQHLGPGEIAGRLGITLAAVRSYQAVAVARGELRQSDRRRR